MKFDPLIHSEFAGETDVPLGNSQKVQSGEAVRPAVRYYYPMFSLPHRLKHFAGLSVFRAKRADAVLGYALHHGSLVIVAGVFKVNESLFFRRASFEYLEYGVKFIIL